MNDSKRLLAILARVERMKLLRDPEDPDPLSQSLEAFFRENTEDDLRKLAAALESDPVERVGRR